MAEDRKKTVFQQAHEEIATEGADSVIEIIDRMNKVYWDAHALVGETSYVSSWEQMRDCERLGQIAEAINLLRKAQQQLRCFRNCTLRD